MRKLANLVGDDLGGYGVIGLLIILNRNLRRHACAQTDNAKF